MLKFLVGSFICANVVLYAYNAGALGSGSSDTREPGRAATELDAQRIRLIDPATRLQPATDADVTGKAAAGANAGAAAVATPMAAVSAAPNVGACIEIGNFDVTDARRFDLQLAPLVLKNRLTQRKLQEVERYIVYIPPLADKASADRKAAELRQLGIDDFYLFGDNSDMRLGISLGMFKTAEAANLHLANLATKGVRSAIVAGRGLPGNRVAFQLRGLSPAEQASVTKIRSGFPRQEARACATP